MDPLATNCLMDHPSVLVVGPGAIGQCVGARLKSIGYDIRYMGRYDHEFGMARHVFVSNSSWMKKNEESTESTTRSCVLEYQVSTINWDWLRNVDMVFVTVKAYQLEQCIGDLVDRYGKLAKQEVSPGTMTPLRYQPIVIVVLANGAVDTIIHTAKIRHNKLGNRPIVWRRGVCYAGISQMLEGLPNTENRACTTYRLTSWSGRVVWGSTDYAQPFADAEMDLIRRDLSSYVTGFFQLQNNIMPDIQKKWLLNVVINTLCAAHDLERNAMILENDDVKEKLPLVCEEAYELGCHLWPDLRQSISLEIFFKDLMSCIVDTSSNENSMRRDLRMKRPTENMVLAGIAFEQDDPALYPNLCEMATAIRIAEER